MTTRANPAMVRSFAKFVVDQGHGALCETSKAGKKVSWQARGRDLFGVEVFNQALLEELAKRKAEAACPATPASPAS